jgi:hypothetical protein
LSLVQLLTHLAEHESLTQESEVWHELVSPEVHATHFPIAPSQTWCIGSQAAQSALTTQSIVGVPWESVGQTSPSGTQLPQLEQVWPVGQPVLVFASHATQRPSSTRHVFRSPSQEPHSASL